MAELKEKMIRDMQLRNFSPRTQESYIHGAKGLVEYYNKSPMKISAEEIEDYILYLKNDRGFSWNTVDGRDKLSQKWSLRIEPLVKELSDSEGVQCSY